MAVVVLCLVLIMGILQRDIRELLVQYQAPMSLLVRFLVYTLPYPLMFAIPTGFFATVLMVFSRLSNHNELVGFRASGTGLMRLAAPVFILGFAFTIICLLISGWASPIAKRNARVLIDSTLKQDPLSLLASNSETKLPNVQAFVTEKTDDTLIRFHLYQLSDDKENPIPLNYIYASEVGLEVDRSQDEFILSFQQALMEELTEDDSTPPRVFTASTAEPWPLAFPSQEIPDKPGYRTTFDLIQLLASKLPEEKRNAILTEIQKRFALSLACLSFAFIAVPLGMSKSRRDSANAGLITGIFVVKGYFILLIIGESLEDIPALSISLMWLPNILCIIFGCLLIRKTSVH